MNGLPCAPPIWTSMYVFLHHKIPFRDRERLNTTMLHDLLLDLAYYHESVTFGANMRSCINAMNAVLESVQDAPRLFKIFIKLIL